MPKVDVYNQKGEVSGKMELPDGLFNTAIDTSLLHRAVVAQRVNNRQGTVHAKDRSEVRGGGRKPWRQKGTGRARHGSIRSPIWRGGGATFGPLKGKEYAVKMNKKEKRAAFRMALGAKLRDNQVMVVDALNFENNKTKEAAEVFEQLSQKLAGYVRRPRKRDTILLVVPGTKNDRTLVRAMNNIPYTESIRADSLNIVDVLRYKYAVILRDAVEVMKNTYVN